MRRALFLILSACMCLAIFGCSSPPADTDTPTETPPAEQSETGNVPEITFDYVVDDAWYPEQFTDTVYAYYLDGSEEGGADVPTLRVEEFYAGETVDDVNDQIAYLEANYTQNVQDLTFTDVESSEIDGYGCVTALYTDTAGNKGKLMVFFTSPSTIGMIDFNAPADVYDEYIDQVDATMNSVSLAMAQ